MKEGILGVQVYSSDNFQNYLNFLSGSVPCLKSYYIWNIDDQISSLSIITRIYAVTNPDEKKLNAVSDNLRTLQENTANIYPNPVDVNITVNNLIGKSTIEIYNSLGLKVFETNATGGREETIQTSTFSTGMYIIKVIGDDYKEATYKMMKK